MSFNSSSTVMNIFIVTIFSIIVLFGFTYYSGIRGFKHLSVLSQTTTDTSVDSSVDTTIFDDEPFTLLSDQFEYLGTLPTDYTCAGDSKSPPLSWINPPEGTDSFIITMSSIWTTEDDSGIKYDWIVYNISSSLNYLDEDVGNTTRKGIWNGVIHGGTYPNRPYYYYVAPCTEGWGVRYYTFTIYALSTNIVQYITDDDSNDLDVANNMIDYIYNNNIVIASSNITVQWERYPIPDYYTVPPTPVDDAPSNPEDEEETDGEASEESDVDSSDIN